MGTESRNSFNSQALDRKVVVIFGGTSGIGLAAATQAKELGARVIVIGSKPDKARQAAEAHRFEGWRAADVTDTNAITRALSDIPHVDHLVLLSGTFVAGHVLDADVIHLRKAFEERIWAAVHALRTLGSRLARDGSITFISGNLADRPTSQGTAILAAASASMEAFARGLALELAPIRVNTLSPGPVNTPLLANTLGPTLEHFVETLEQKLPLHRLATAEEAGSAVVFLMANAYMNGATLNVDGGARLV